MKLRELVKIIAAPIGLASLCCMGPALFVTLGISTVSFAASLANTWYGTYKWVFRSIGLISLIISLVLYFRKTHNICTLSQVKRQRNMIINTVSIVIISSVLAYIFFLYVVVHYWGVWLAIW